MARFFAAIGENLDMHRFEPHAFIAQDEHVVVLVSTEATAKRTGRKVANHVAHVWTFKGGKLAHFEAFSDSLRQRSLPTAEAVACAASSC